MKIVYCNNAKKCNGPKLFFKQKYIYILQFKSFYKKLILLNDSKVYTATNK